MIKTKQIVAEPQSCEAQATFPAAIPNKGSWYTKVVDGVTELFYTDDAGNNIQLSNKGSVNLPVIPSLIPVGGSTNQILTKTSNSDHATGWRSVGSVLNEFSFLLPAGADIVARITAAGSLSGLSLVTAQSDIDPVAEFGSSSKTLVIKPTDLSNIVVTDISVIELVTTGADIDKGWRKLANPGAWKGNIAKTKACIIDFQDYIDASRPVLVKVRFAVV